MKLHRVRVTDYKSVLDSEWFTLEQLTCLVGKNESGKSALLEAMEKLGSVRSERESLAATDYPRMNQAEYEDSGAVATAVVAEWLLNDAEAEQIGQILGDVSLLASRVVTVSKNYANELEWDLPFDTAAVVAHAVKNAGLTNAERDKLGTHSTTTAFIEAVETFEEPSPAMEAFAEEITSRWNNSVQKAVRGFLSGAMPKFVYYSQYDRLPGRVSLDQLLGHKAAGTLHQLAGAEVFIALLSMVGTTPEAISEIDRSEELLGRLEGVENRLTRKIFSYWSQNTHLEVRFRFDPALVGDDAPFNSGKVFQTRIRNSRHKVTIGLDERSTGFIWFFSFLVWFSEVQKQFGENLIVLLDEPGLALHARAQEDLLTYIKSELTPKYQVVYTTHSPFMVDPANLLSCRTVEDVTGQNDEVLGTKVGDSVLSTDSDTLFPLQAALGYDLTQTLFIGAHTLLVEGPSDLLFIQWASAKLRSADRAPLDSRWTVVPAGGIAKIPSFLALFGGNKLHVAVLTDYGDGDKAKVREIRESELLEAGHVYSADQLIDPAPAQADVEDVLGRELYIDLVRATYGLGAKQVLPKKRPTDAPQRVIKEVEDHFKLLPPPVEEFDHFTPAAYLIANPNEFDGVGVSAALDRFESFFQRLNALL